MKNNFKIYHVASEFYPYSKTGGLAHVVADLCRNISSEEVQVSVFIPMYKSVRKMLMLNAIKLFSNIKISEQYFNCWLYKEKQKNGSEINIYIIENYDLFGKYLSNYYADPETYKSFYYFNKVVTKLIGKIGCPDIIHCHDWMTGLLPEMMRQTCSKTKTLFTIHNLAFQGSNKVNQSRFDNRNNINVSKLPSINSTKFEDVNFLKRGIHYADFVSTVSRTYAKEIVGHKYGEGLDLVLKQKDNFFGITNGIDYSLFDPSNAKYLNQPYSEKNSILIKNENKIALLKHFKINTELISRPVIIMNHRLSYQKGFSLLKEKFDELIKLPIILIILGSGDLEYIHFFNEKRKCKLDNFRFITPFNEKDEFIMLAGGDIILCPSMYEPCGTSHLKAMRYGIVPIVRSIGGLNDTVIDVIAKPQNGYSLTFSDFESDALIDIVEIGINFYNKKRIWKSLIQRCMKRDFSWNKAIKKYLKLYRNLLKL